MPRSAKTPYTQTTRFASVLATLLVAVLVWSAPAWASTALDASPTTLAFNDHGIHDGNGETQTVTLTYEGGDPTSVSSVALSGADAGQFSLAYDNCNNRFFSNPGDQCTVGVQFSPSTIGPHSA